MATVSQYIPEQRQDVLGKEFRVTEASCCLIPFPCWTLEPDQCRRCKVLQLKEGSDRELLTSLIRVSA